MIEKYYSKEKLNLLVYNIGSYLCLIVLYFLRESSFIRPITLSIIMILLFVSIMLFGYRKDRNNSIKIKIFLEFTIVLLIYLTITYSLGMKVDFTKHIYNFAKLEEIFYITISIVLTEILRYTLYSKNLNDKKQHFITIVFFTILEILIINNYCFLDNKIIISLLSLEKNIVLNYNCKNGYKINLTYAFLIELLPNIISYPNLSNYLYIIFLTIMNSVLLILVLKPNRKKELETANNYKKGFLVVVETTLCIFVIIIITLISGFFKYTMSSIASNSMYPTLQKGDAIIIKQLTDKEKKKIEVGDIIVFQEEGHIITHRVIEIKEGIYITKGDNNNTKDITKKTKNDIIGLVKIRIPYLGYPSVYISEVLNR